MSQSNRTLIFRDRLTHVLPHGNRRAGGTSGFQEVSMTVLQPISINNVLTFCLSTINTQQETLTIKFLHSYRHAGRIIKSDCE